MSQKEISARHYKKRKENGLCIRCGKPLDRKGIYCSDCLKARRKYLNETREFYRKNHLCYICGKNQVFGNEKSCPECRAKEQTRRDNYTEEEKDKRYRKYYSKKKEKNKQLIKERIEKGLCTKCGKRKADAGYKTCSICRRKNTEYKRKKTYNRDKRSDRIKIGLCYFCDNPVEDGFKVCKEHRQLNIQNARSDKAKQIRKQLVEQGILC